MAVYVTLVLKYCNTTTFTNALKQNRVYTELTL